MTGEQQLRTAARWRSAPVPEGFGAKPGPVLEPIIELPLVLDWSWGDEPNEWGTVEELDIAQLYARVLEVGTITEVETYIDPVRLNELWDNHFWTGAVRETWESWIARYRAERAT